jgi:hypothetical protein
MAIAMCSGLPLPFDHFPVGVRRAEHNYELRRPTYAAMAVTYPADLASHGAL